MTSTTFFIIFIPILSILLLSINLLLAPHNPYQEKNSAFECGFHSFLDQNRTQFSISFFIFGLLFLLFDLEILLVYPYSVSGYNNDIYGLIIMMIFFVLLTLGFIFELGKNALTIDSKQTFSFNDSDTPTPHAFFSLLLTSAPQALLDSIGSLRTLVRGVPSGGTMKTNANSDPNYIYANSGRIMDEINRRADNLTAEISRIRSRTTNSEEYIHCDQLSDIVKQLMTEGINVVKESNNLAMNLIDDAANYHLLDLPFILPSFIFRIVLDKNFRFYFIYFYNICRDNIYHIFTIIIISIVMCFY